MNRTLLSTLLAIGSLFLAGLHRASAEAETVDSVVDLLHQAETASDPGPLLEKAKDALKKFNPKPKLAAGTVGAKRRGGIDSGAAKHKEEAMEAIDKAIAAAKGGASAAPATAAGAAPSGTTGALGTAMDSPGSDMKAKIENAISKVHQAGEMKR